MALLTPDQCRAQCRVDGSYSDAELAALLASAEDIAAAYLNRTIYADQGELDAALGSLPGAAGNAAQAYDDAITAADAEQDQIVAEAMRSVADAKLSAAKLASARAVAGIVANASILAAVRLVLGHLWANRETVVVGDSAVSIPLGAEHLLRPYRLVMMP